nr:hypothetical protein [Tanacetum cinerariifolium]
PLPHVGSPTVESLGYVAESDPEEDPKEYEDDKTEDGPVDYAMNGGDDGDGDSSGDDTDDEDEEEEEEHLAPTDSAIVIPTDELIAPPEGTEPVIPPPSTDTATTGARITNDDQPLPRVTQVSIAGTTLVEQPPLKDKSMWSDQEKRVHKIDRLARSLLIQGLPNDIYSLVRTMDTTIDQQVAMDEALVPHACRLWIGRSNFYLLSDISFKESTLQLVYDATTTVHYHSIRFKMDNKKHIINLESFREMLHVCPRIPGQSFVEPPFEEEILAFLQFLGHSGAIRRLIDVDINKLHQPRRSFAAIIKKCLTGKSSGYDSLRLSQAQILWGYTTRGMLTSLILCGKSSSIR